METKIFQILVVKFGALGDVVRTSYMLPALAQKYPHGKITWLTSPAAYALLRFNPYIDELVTPGFGAEDIHDRAFDLAVSLDDEVEILRQVQRMKIGSIVGARLESDTRTYCAKSAAWFDMGLISKHGRARADEFKRVNQREHHTFLEEMIGASITEPTFFNSRITETRMARIFAKPYFHIGLNSGAGARWPAKQLPIEEAGRLVANLGRLRVAGKPVLVWLLGGEAEGPRNQQIAAAAATEQVRILESGVNILEFAASIRALDYLVSSDSLALHLGIAQRVPSLSFFAPTSAAEIGTFGRGTKVISTAPDYCNYRPDADNRTITAERLLAAAVAHWGKMGLTQA